MRKSFIKVSVYFSDLQLEILTDQVKVTVADLITTVGAALALWSGITIVLLVELIELVICMIQNLQGRNYNVKPTTMESNIPDTQEEKCIEIYSQISNINRNIAGETFVDHSEVVGASPVGAAPNTSSFST